MPGTHDGPRTDILHVIDCDSTMSIAGTVNGAVVASQILKSWVAPFPCRLGAIKFYATAAGTGAGNTVMDVQIGGTSVWTSTANRPTLLSTSTGEFLNPQADGTAVQFGNLVTLRCISISTTGPKVCGSVDIVRA